MGVDGRVIANGFLLGFSPGPGGLPEAVRGRREQRLELVESDPAPGLADVVVVPEKHMDQGGGETSVGGDEVVDVRGGQVRDTNLIDGVSVDGEV